MKRCSGCKVEKPFEEFSKDKSRKDGYSNQCKSCVKKYYEENKDKISEQQKQYYEENKDKRSEYQKQYREENKDKVNSLAAKRRAQKLQATPSWLAEEHYEEMQDFYTICKMFQIYTGLTYHVDHVLPLQGEDVCGLHVPWNLQILEASENLSKSNRLLEEYLYE